MAAKDAAYLFFDLRPVPLDAWIKVQAQTFESDRQWERKFTLC
jgi:hypothetical protein